MKKKRTVKVGIVVAILMLMVGFATVSTTLYITGQASVGSNQTDFENNVVFAKDPGNEPKIEAQLDTPCDEAAGECGFAEVQGHDPDGTGAKIQDNEIVFVTPVMRHIGDKVTVSYKVKNNSTNYDARMGALTCNVVQETDSEQPAETVNWEDYITVTPRNLKNGALVQADGIYDTYDTIEIEMIKSYVGEVDLSFAISCTIDATAEVISK